MHQWQRVEGTAAAHVAGSPGGCEGVGRAAARLEGSPAPSAAPAPPACINKVCKRLQASVDSSQPQQAFVIHCSSHSDLAHVSTKLLRIRHYIADSYHMHDGAEMGPAPADALRRTSLRVQFSEALGWADVERDSQVLQHGGAQPGVVCLNRGELRLQRSDADAPRSLQSRPPKGVVVACIWDSRATAQVQVWQGDQHCRQCHTHYSPSSLWYTAATWVNALA